MTEARTASRRPGGAISLAALRHPTAFPAHPHLLPAVVAFKEMFLEPPTDSAGDLAA